MFKTVGLVARYDKKPALKLAEELLDYLAKKEVYKLAKTYMTTVKKL